MPDSIPEMSRFLLIFMIFAIFPDFRRFSSFFCAFSRRFPYYSAIFRFFFIFFLARCFGFFHVFFRVFFWIFPDEVMEEIIFQLKSTQELVNEAGLC